MWIWILFQNKCFLIIPPPVSHGLVFMATFVHKVGKIGLSAFKGYDLNWKMKHLLDMTKLRFELSHNFKIVYCPELNTFV